MAKIENLKGYCYPLTPGGKSSIVGDLPWHYGADFLNVVYESDLEAVASFIPEPLKPGENPGQVCASFSKWWSQWDNQPELAFINPERTQYTELDIWVNFEFQGEQVMLCVYAWVDNDFTMLRGHFMGYPKKLGKTYITESHPLIPGWKPLGVGSKFKAYTVAHGERVAEGTLEIQEKIAAEDLPMSYPIMNIRHFPTMIPGAPPAVHELIKMKNENFKMSDIWKGDASIQLFPSEIEEHTLLKVNDILGGYRFSLGQSIVGAEVLHSWV